MLLRYISTLLVLSLTERSIVSGVLVGRVTLGDKVRNFCTVANPSGSHRYYYGTSQLYVHSIQEDKRERGNILAAIGNALYTINKDGYAQVLAGSETAGNSNGNALLTARFNVVAGFHQVDRNIILFSDRDNHCIRQLNRTYHYNGLVSTYAGHCDNTDNNYHRYTYSAWRTFNSPTGIYLDEANILHVLDVIEGKSVIVTKDLSTGVANRRQYVGVEVRNFLYEFNTSSYIVTDLTGVYNVTSKYEKKRIGSVDATKPYGLTLTNGILLVTDQLYGGISAVDTERDNSNDFTLCRTNWKLPYCNLDNPTAVAVIGDYLYFSSSTEQVSHQNYIPVASIKRVPFSSYTLDEYSKLTTTTTTEFRLPDYDSSGLPSSTIIVICMLTLITLSALIIWAVMRRRRRRRMLHAAGATVVSVSPCNTTATVVQSTLPYGRLQESYPPPTELPPAPRYTELDTENDPPAYTPTVQGP